MDILQQYINFIRKRNSSNNNNSVSSPANDLTANAILDYLETGSAENIFADLRAEENKINLFNHKISAGRSLLTGLIPEFTKDVKEAVNIIEDADKKLAALQDTFFATFFKNNENELHEIEPQYLRFLDDLSLAVFAVNADGTPFFTNKYAKELLGHDPDYMPGDNEVLNAYKIYYSGTEDSYPREEMPINKALHGESSYKDDLEISVQGKTIPLEVWSGPVMDKNNKIIYAIAIFNDLTKRKDLEEELRRKEVFLDSIIEYLPNMLFVKDAKDLKFIRFNQAGENLLGYKREDLIGKNDYDFFPEEQADFFTAKDRAVLDSGNLLDIPEEVIQTNNKGERILHTQKIPVLDHKGRPQYLLGISQDITEQKKAQDALQQRTEELARSNTDLEQFAYVASHDLQEPLRSVASYVQLLARRYNDKLDNDGREFIAFAVDGVNRMQNLISGLLQYSRISTRGQEPMPTDITNILDTVQKNLHEAIVESNTKINIGKMPVVKADEAQMIQLFQNLISNAIKFKGKSNPVIEIEAKKKADMWLFSIKDNGIGIPKDSLERIFIIFQRLHGRDEYKGTGIGLAVCKKIVERHNGRIWAESEPGKGTTFYFTLKNSPASQKEQKQNA